MKKTIACLALALTGAACGDGGPVDHEIFEHESSNPLITEQVTYVSDIAWVGTLNAWGPVERDRSNGEQGATDGNRITLNGIGFNKGVGMHAPAAVWFDARGQYARLEARIGIDDESGIRGSANFIVLADGVRIYESGVMTGTSATKAVRLDITGKNRIELIALDGGDNFDWDHADWADVKLIKLVDTGTPAPAPPAPPASKCQLGPSGSLGGRQVFPRDNEWNRDISSDPVDPNSHNYINSIGAGPLRPDFGTTYEGAPWGIPYVVVPPTQPKLPIGFDYDDESDPGPYPFPLNAPIEGGPNGEGDRHIIAVDCEGGRLYETFYTFPNGGGFDASSGAVFNLDSNALRPERWTSADAAGLPVFAGLVRYDEVVERGEITHALRFTVRNSQRAYVWPARHFASTKTDPNLPPMGMRVRLKASFDISGFPKEAQVILRALKKYGMFMADNGGDWFLSGAPHPSWNEANVQTLRRVKGTDFEVVKMGPIKR